MKSFYALLFLAFTVGNCFAQEQNNQWYFGDGAGLDFNSGTPVPISTGQLYTNEGCASIADESSGNLLFYTDGTFAYDRTNNQMPNGYFMGGDESTTQSALIVPESGSNTLYYVFTADAQVGSYGTGDGGVNYNIVDMTQNGGLGDVTTLDAPLLIPATEKLCGAFACNGIDYWVIAHQWNTNAFYAYLITDAGISAPVISYSGIVHEDVGSFDDEEAIGYMEVSPDGKKLALACYVDLNTVQIFDFDNSSGIVSNPITDTNFPDLSGQDGPYGVCFSPDNSELYIGYAAIPPTFCQVYQYNMLAGNGAAIIASRTSVASDTAYTYGALQIGPDNKIYVAKSSNDYLNGSYYLDVIENPNGLGAACDYVDDGLYLGNSGAQSVYGLPNTIQNFVPSGASLTIIPQSPVICSGQNVTLTVSGGTGYTWSPETGLNATTGDSVIASPTLTVTYTVTSTGSGCQGTGTDVVHVIPSPNKPTFYQHGDTLISSSLHDNQWYINDTLLFNDTSRFLIITRVGEYLVNVLNEANGCSTSSDSTNITQITGVNQLSVNSNPLSIYPNPFTNEIVVKINSSLDISDWKLQVTDVLGRPLYSMPSLNYSNEIDLSSLSSGVYFITVINKIGRATFAEIKQN